MINSQICKWQDAGISIYLYIGYCGNLVDLNVMKYYCLLLSFLWGLVVSVSGQERISVCNLRCEYLEDPDCGGE